MINMIRLISISVSTLVILFLLMVIRDRIQTSPTETVEYIPIMLDATALGIQSTFNSGLCFVAPPSTRTWEEVRQNPPLNRGIGHYIEPSAITDSRMIGYNTFEVPAEQPLTVTWRVLYVNNDAPDSRIPLRYVALLNEAQLNISSDEHVHKDIELLQGEDITLTINIPPLTAGIHDLLLVGVQQLPMNAVGISQTFGMRISLIAGDDPIFETKNFELLHPHPQSYGERGVFNLGVHLEESQLWWAYPEIYASFDERTSFYISVGYGENMNGLLAKQIQPLPSFFALTAFLEGQQVSIRAGKPVLYGVVEPSTAYSFVRAFVPQDLPSQDSELLVMRINYPRIPMCWLMDNDNGYYFDPGPYIGRVGIMGQRSR